MKLLAAILPNPFGHPLPFLLLLFHRLNSFRTVLDSGQMFSILRSTLVYLIAEQDVLSEQALNSKIHPARFLLSAYEVSNKRAGTK